MQHAWLKVTENLCVTMIFPCTSLTQGLPYRHYLPYLLYSVLFTVLTDPYTVCRTPCPILRSVGLDTALTESHELRIPSSVFDPSERFGFHSERTKPGET
jgi:hypothetical protein